MNKKGFTLVEILIGLVILQVALLSFFAINQSSNSRSMDAYYEFLACSLGKEVLELSQGMGYKWTAEFKAKPDLFPLDSWHGILEYPIFDKTSYFSECADFERKVSFTAISGNVAGTLVQVFIRPKKDNKASSWLSRDSLSFSTIVMEKPVR